MKYKSEKSLIEAFKAEEKRLEIYKNVREAIEHWQEYSLEEKGKFISSIPYDIAILPETDQDIFIRELSRVEICKKRELTKNVKKFKKVIPEEELRPKPKFNPKHYAEMIFKDFHFKADELDRFYIYDEINGIWRKKADIYLRHYLRKKYLDEKDLKKYCVNEIVAHIKDLSFLDIEKIEDLKPPLNLIPFANCIYDLDTNKIIEYSPEYFFTTKLKVKYNPDCGGCPTIDRIFHEIVREEDVITLYEIAGYSMYRDYPYPKIFFIYGSGGNGKTTFSNILIRLFGVRNVSTENSYSLQKDKFASGGFFEKYINVSMEMEYTLLRNTELLKRLTGFDLIKCDRKFKEPFQFYNYAKMIFMGNAIPETLDTSPGWYRRVSLTEFPFKFVEGKNADPDIVKNLPQSEIEGLALWAVIKLRELRERKFVFTRHEEILKVKEKYEALSNPLAKFLEDFTEKDYMSEIFCDEFYEKFAEFLQEKEMRPMEQNAVGRRMTKLGFKNKEVTRFERRGYAYLGLKWTS